MQGVHNGDVGWSVGRKWLQAAAPLDGTIAGYERFAEDTLKPRLERVLRERDSIYANQEECAKLRNFLTERIEAAEAAGGYRPLQTMVDLGHRFFVQARVPEPSKIFVNVGLGVHAQFTLPEAAAFLERREAALDSRAEELTRRAADLKLQHKVALEAIAEHLEKAGYAERCQT
eukprot:TRINITY_DN27128_c0_g1_i1.p1 TRINITY_DN27128_c0_g1~~TRINITY_DN27128_c0_g1_i1.p1  ORF type:complete len:197 (+),score=67.94 TRINITY_DN27128_c0_g1_i1:72-593(+)